MVKFNKEQQQAIEAYEGAYGIVAAAGSGKCVKGDSLIITDKGIIQIEDIPKHYQVTNNECEAGIYSLDINKNKFMKKDTSHWFDMGQSETIRLTTSQGFQIEGTPEHPIVVLNESGNLEFKKLGEIKADDILAINRGANLWGEETLINEELAYFIGLIIGDGYIAGEVGQISFSKSDPYLRGKYIELVYNLFKDYGVNISVIHKKGTSSTNICFYSAPLKKKLQQEYGLKMVKSEFKEIPQSIMRSPKEVIVKCLQGLFDTDGSFHAPKGMIEYCTKSPRLAKQIQTILLNLGIVSRIKVRKPKNYPNNEYYYLYIGGSNTRLFKELVGFRYAREKQKKLDDRYYDEKLNNDNVHLYYNQSQRLRRIREIAKSKDYYFGRKQKLLNHKTNKYINFRDYTSGYRNLTKGSIKSILEILDFSNEDTQFLQFISDNIFFDKIKSIEDSESIVYDFTVPDTHSFISNGFISHNTAVLTNRIDRLVHVHGEKQSDILAVSFTNKTASELKSKLKKMELPDVNVGTFHSICGKILTQEGYNLKLIAEWQKDNFIKMENKYAQVEDVKSFISYQKNHNRSYEDSFVHKESDYDEVTLRQYYKTYETMKEKYGIYDFDDYLTLCLDVLQRNKGKYTYKFILVDEHQDTNLVQNMILQELCQSGNIFCLFDPRQAIFSFRGGDVEYCMNFDKYWDNPTIINLYKNYRSAKNIVEGANRFIKPYFSHYEHYVDSEANNQSDGIVELQAYMSREIEGVEVVDKIEELIEQGEKLSEIAVLYRMNIHSSFVENELKRRGIDYEITNSAGFFKLKEVEAILAYLRLLHNPHDDQAFEIVFKARNYPLKFMKNTVIDQAKQYSGLHDISLYEAFITMPHDNKQKRNVSEFETYISRLRLQADKNVNVISLINNIVKSFSIESTIQTGYMNPDEVKDRLQSIEILKSFVKNNNLEQFIAYVYSNNTKKKSKKNSVKLMSAHSSKGLEWTTTFLIGLETGKFPHERAPIEDESKLFYVAVTRAKKNLYISEIGSEPGVNQFTREYYQ